MSNRLKAVTIRVEPEMWGRVERLAHEARRAPAELARLMLEDAIAARRADVGEIHA
jgi:predicted transcriptional regulator